MIGAPCDPERAEPLEVRATLSGRVSMPHGPIAIDALLAWVTCAREGVDFAHFSDEVLPVEIPVAREPGGRFHLASFAQFEWEKFSPRWINRRFPIPEAQAMGDGKLRRVRISAGAQKSYRLPLESGHVRDDVVRWWLVGDRERVGDLLASVDHVGKKRGSGTGRVASWGVAIAASPWAGFPVVSPEGEALRTLPMNWPGLVKVEPGYKTISYPYWQRDKEELCATCKSPAVGTS